MVFIAYRDHFNDCFHQTIKFHGLMKAVVCLLVDVKKDEEIIIFEL